MAAAHARPHHLWYACMFIVTHVDDPLHHKQHCWAPSVFASFLDVFFPIWLSQKDKTVKSVQYHLLHIYYISITYLYRSKIEPPKNPCISLRQFNPQPGGLGVFFFWTNHGSFLPPVLANFRAMGGSEIRSKKRPSMRREAGSICSGKEHKTCNMKARRTPKTNLKKHGWSQMIIDTSGYCMSGFGG